MSEETQKQLPNISKTIRRQLIFIIFTPPVVWALHEMISLVIAEQACQQGVASMPFIALVSISAAALILTLISISMGIRLLSQQRRESAIFSLEGWDPIQFLALFATFVAGLLLLNMLYFSVLPLLVTSCV